MTPTDGPYPFELLANYLKPRFGNIYDDPDAGEGQPWSPELKDAVRHFLLHVLDDRVFAELRGHPGDQLPDESARQREVDKFIAGGQPWEVALAVHYAAVVVVPTLDELIGQWDTWPSGEEEFDVETWLEAHASGDQIREMADFCDRPDLWPPGGTWKLAGVLAPRELLAAWHHIVGPAPSDLTEDEWQLLEPYAPTPGKSSTAEALADTRQALNGMLYRLDYKYPGRIYPTRYGKPRKLHVRFSYYKKMGIFARMRRPLEGNPKATRIVEGLRRLELLASDARQPAAPTRATDQQLEPTTPPTDDALRAWARSKGYKVGDRGRMAGEIRRRYEEEAV